MTLTHSERVDVYAVTGQPPFSGAHWEREITPQQVKVTLRPADDNTWTVVSVSIHGTYTEPDDMPGTLRCHYYSGERLTVLPDFAKEAIASSLTVSEAA